jgi:hypothetical protein
MKKLILAGSILSLFAFTSIQAQTTQPEEKKTVTNERGQFKDADKNGTCDNFQQRPAQGRRQNFVDANNDGVCDQTGNNAGRGKGIKKGQKNRKGNCEGPRQGRGNRGRGAGNQGAPAQEQK